jgi:hypothetical protein
MLDAGFHDDYKLHWGHRLLSHYLTEAGVIHEHRENPGNHGGRFAERYQVALEWLSESPAHPGPSGTRLSWAIQDSNLGPLPYQRSALTD